MQGSCQNVEYHPGKILKVLHRKHDSRKFWSTFEYSAKCWKYGENFLETGRAVCYIRPITKWRGLYVYSDYA